MMQDWPLLSLTTFLPLVGASFILIIRGDAEVVARNARYVALWTSLTTFVLSLFIWFGFERGTADFQFVEEGKMNREQAAQAATADIAEMS